MRINKRALIVEGILIWIIGTGIIGIKAEVTIYPVGSFFAGIFVFSSIAFACIVLFICLKDIIIWINEDRINDKS